MYFCQPLLLICTILILAVHTQSQKDLKGPGRSSCCFSDFRHNYCNFSEVRVTDIPQECTSLVFSGAYVSSEFQVDNSDLPINYTVLDELLKSEMNVFIYYGPGFDSNWTLMFANEFSNAGNNLSKVMKGLDRFLADHKRLAGLILTAIQFLPDGESEFPSYYTEDFKKYLDVLRNNFPELIIGLDIFGSILIDQYMYPNWLNISVINSAIDFYAVTTEYFNSCTDDFRYTGTVPMNGSNTNHTLDKLKDALQQQCFPIEKTYFKFILNPDTPDADILTMCDVNIEKLCTQPQVTCDWCAEPLLSYNEKGQFSRTNGAGFMARYIDFDDPNNCCNCEKPFPTFNAILDGFNGVSTKACDLLNLR